MLTLLSILVVAGCGSRDSNNQKKDGNSSADSVQTSTTEAETDTLITKELNADADTTGLVQKTGTLNYSGSEPFVSPTLFVSDSESYRLIADQQFMKETFESINGKHATIYGKEKAMGNSTLLEVHYYEISEEN